MIFSALGLIVSVIALVFIVKFLRSTPVRSGIRAARSSIAGLFRWTISLLRRPKIALKRKGNIKAAQELMYWSELKDKGDISQEEFDERKKELLGKT